MTAIKLESATFNKRVIANIKAELPKVKSFKKYRIEINLINIDSLKNKHCNGYYLYKLL